MPFEEWEADHRISRTVLIIGLTFVVIAAAVVGYAVYNIVSPDSDPVNVTDPATLSKPTTNATGGAIVGDTIQISTQLSDHTAGLQIFFFEDNQQLGSAYTNDQGVAIYNRLAVPLGSHVYRAECVHP